MQLLFWVLRQKFAFSFWNIVYGVLCTAVHNVMDISPSSNSNQEMDVVADHEQVPNKWKRLYEMNQWPPRMPTAEHVQTGGIGETWNIQIWQRK